MTKTLAKTLAKFQEINTALAEKYQCKISIGLMGKEICLADGRKITNTLKGSKK